ncbi:MAG: ATP-binding cassette domain-containing protein, partial [Clostridia bacterium]
MIVVNDVVKRYGEAMVLDHVSVTFADRQIHGLIGRNGSGKTLLMKTILGLIRATSGTVEVDGKTIRRDVEVPDRVGAIIETPGFLPYDSGRKNLLLLASLRKRVGRAQVDEAMRKVGLDPKSRKWVSKYSMGMKQRLGIAQA